MASVSSSATEAASHPRSTCCTQSLWILQDYADDEDNGGGDDDGGGYDDDDADDDDDDGGGYYVDDYDRNLLQSSRLL